MQAALDRPFWDLEDVGDFCKAEAGTKHETQDLALPSTQHGDGSNDIRHLDAIEGQHFGTRRRVRTPGKDRLIHGCRSVSTHTVAGLPERDGDHPGAHFGVPAEAGRVEPDGNHGVLQDLLTHTSITDDEENLAEKDTSVAPVQIA